MYIYLKWSEVKSLSHVQLFVTPWTVAYQAPQSVGFSRQEYWSGLPFPSPEDLPHPGIKPRSPTVSADALLSEPPAKSRESRISIEGRMDKYTVMNSHTGILYIALKMHECISMDEYQKQNIDLKNLAANKWKKLWFHFCNTVSM